MPPQASVIIYIYCIYNLHNGEWASVFNALFKTQRISAFAFLRGLYMQLLQSKYIEDITRWREDMNFMFSWQEQYLTSEILFLHENIKFISSSQRVMFFLLFGETNSTKAKGGNRDVIERYDTHKVDIRKICQSGPG